MQNVIEQNLKNNAIALNPKLIENQNSFVIIDLLRLIREWEEILTLLNLNDDKVNKILQ